MCKRFEGAMKYGRGQYDFNQGSLMFTAPQQVIASSTDIKNIEGWGLFFHPDLLHNTELGRTMREYTFFKYEVNEALHISEEENMILLDCLNKIKKGICSGARNNRFVKLLLKWVLSILLILPGCSNHKPGKAPGSLEGRTADKFPAVLPSEFTDVRRLLIFYHSGMQFIATCVKHQVINSF
jgi:hypothetical protein